MVQNDKSCANSYAVDCAGAFAGHFLGLVKMGESLSICNDRSTLHNPPGFLQNVCRSTPAWAIFAGFATALFPLLHVACAVMVTTVMCSAVGKRSHAGSPLPCGHAHGFEAEIRLRCKPGTELLHRDTCGGGVQRLLFRPTHEPPLSDIGILSDSCTVVSTPGCWRAFELVDRKRTTQLTVTKTQVQALAYWSSIAKFLGSMHHLLFGKKDGLRSNFLRCLHAEDCSLHAEACPRPIMRKQCVRKRQQWPS